MTTHYKVDTISRVQAVLQDQPPLDQTLMSRVVEMKHSDVNDLEEFPDEPVSNGTRIYQIFRDGRVFEICVLRG